MRRTVWLFSLAFINIWFGLWNIIDGSILLGCAATVCGLVVAIEGYLHICGKDEA